MRKQGIEDSAGAFYDPLFYEDEVEETPEPDRFMERLVKGAMERAPEIDQRISAHSEHWRLDRMSAVDRNILRLAVYEMLEGLTPPAVVIDEALELARRFSGEDSVAFINGVLDAIYRSGVGSTSSGT